MHFIVVAAELLRGHCSVHVFVCCSGVPKVFDAFEGHVRQQNVCADPMRMAKGFARVSP